MNRKITAVIGTGILAGALAMGACAEEAFDFGKLSDQTFIFSSGAGAWDTTLEISEDGSFTGDYHDSEMGDMGEDYPLGTVYGCLFHGQLTLGEQISDTAYSVTVESCEPDEGQLEETIEDEIRYVTTDPYGLKEGDQLVLYLPGQKVEELSEELIPWLHLEAETEAAETLEVYALCNEKEGLAFVSFEKMEELANPWEETDEAGLLEATGLSLAVPEGAEDVSYMVMASEGLGQMEFTLNGLYYTARIKAAAEYEDISGLYYEWASEEDCKIDRCEGKILQAPEGEQTVTACLWFDVAPGIMYSLCTTTDDVEAAQIQTVAEAVFKPMQGEA